MKKLIAFALFLCTCTPVLAQAPISNEQSRFIEVRRRQGLVLQELVEGLEPARLPGPHLAVLRFRHRRLAWHRVRGLHDGG